MLLHNDMRHSTGVDMRAKEQETSVFPKIGAPAIRALEGAGYSQLEKLTKVTEAELG